MKVVVCDDEAVFRDALISKIRFWAESHQRISSLHISSFHSSEEFMEAWDSGLEPDLLFIDIQFPDELSGIDLANFIYQQNCHLPIVFVSNYPQYACEGYRVNALRFISKPFSQDSIDECLDIVWRQWSLKTDSVFQIALPRHTIRLPIKQIISIESSGHNLIIYTADQTGRYEYRASLDIPLRQLPYPMFIQCYRSIIVNLAYIKMIKNREITLLDDRKLPVGAKYSARFFQGYQEYNLGILP